MAANKRSTASQADGRAVAVRLLQEIEKSSNGPKPSIGTDPGKLEYRRGKMLSPVHRLPFVGGKSTGRHRGVSYWNVPASGGYHGGTETGGALVLAYLKFLRETPENITTVGLLQLVVLDMCGRLASAKGHERRSLRGQIVGFLHELDRLAREAVQVRPELDQISEAEILNRANAGLEGWINFGEILKTTRKAA